MRGLGLLGRGLVDGISYEYMIPLTRILYGLETCMVCVLSRYPDKTIA